MLNPHLLDRAKTDSFAFLRLLNIRGMAIAMNRSGNVDALENFCIEWLPLKAYLAIDLNDYRGINAVNSEVAS